MSKLNFSFIIVLLFMCFCVYKIETEYKGVIPLFQLPEVSHNTIGDIPLIEVWDDGTVKDLKEQVKELKQEVSSINSSGQGAQRYDGWGNQTCVTGDSIYYHGGYYQ